MGSRSEAGPVRLLGGGDRVHVDAAYGGYFGLCDELGAGAADAYSAIESADSVVVMEGRAAREEEPELLEDLGKAFLHKYQIEVVGNFPDAALYSVRPHRVMAWQGFPESEFTRTMTRFDLS